MLPRWHILLGALFTILLWVLSPQIQIFYLILVFAASVLIDFDHYLCAIYRTKKFSIREALKYHVRHIAHLKKQEHLGMKPRSDFHLFHTIEFHFLIGLLSIAWTPFFYFFIGMVFHSLVDLYDGLRNDTIHRREYFFFNWLRQRF